MSIYRLTTTGGREATDKRIMGNVALAVNHPGTPAPRGWEWHQLTTIARMESGHTPSRKRPEYWGGDIPWLGIKDAKRAHGGTATETLEYTNELGINNSSARVLPAGTVCLSRTASVGYVVKMGRDMATSQDFANWICSDRIDPDFLRYLFLAEGSALSRFSSGSVHQTIYYPELKAFHVCIPSLEEQQRIVAVLDQAFAALDRARANAEANLTDAQNFFLTALRSIFANNSKKWLSNERLQLTTSATPASTGKRSKAASQTGGRDATTRPIEGDYSLSVLMPRAQAREGWVWSPLSKLARLESGHTPSRKHPEYWGGDIGWLGIKDARDHHGGVITKTREQTNALGIKNSSARVLPKGTVCLSRTASVGYVVTMGADMATSQDFVNWICGPHLEPDFLKFLLLAQGDDIRKFASGSVHQTIYFPEVKAFHISHPSRDVQKQICKSLHRLRDEAVRMEDAYRSKLADIADLRQSLLQKAFSGQLT